MQLTFPRQREPQPLERSDGDARSVVCACLFWGIAAGISILFSYRWIDRPVATLIHDNVRSKPEVQALCVWLSALPDLLTGLWIAAALGIPLLLWAITSNRRPINQGRLQSLLIAGACSFLVSATAKMVLKWSCGRTWPETWIYQNPSYIRDGAYGFFPFHGGAGWSSFPSGHMAAATTVAMVGWHLAPQYRAAWAIVAIGTAIGLTALNLHFVSGIIAGGYLGAASSAAAIWFANSWSRRPIPQNSEQIAT